MNKNDDNIKTITVTPVEVGFTCRICDGFQVMQEYVLYPMPICDKCIAVMRDMIGTLSKLK